MTGRFFSRLLFSFVLVLCIGTAILDLSLRRIVEHSLHDEAQNSLAGKARLLASEADLNKPAELKQLAIRGAFDAGAQVTFFAPDGRILADSLDATADNEVPPEVREASISPRRIGQDERSGQLFVAVPGKGLVVRLAYSLSDIEATMHVLRRDLLLASVISMLLATLLAAFFARRLSSRLGRIVVFANRIAAGEFSARIFSGRDRQDLDEISAVGYALDATADRLEQSFHALESKQRELAALLDSMQEAVVAVNANAQVSWSNTVMQRISPSPVREGRALVQTIRDPDVLDCVDRALKQREICSGRATSMTPGRIFEVNAAPTPGGGAVAVLHDITEVDRVEKTRRDFIANVSHELRTPLTSISGYVETLLEDVVELPEHAREFLNIILKNAKRMNRLTEDLLALASVESGEYKLRPQRVKASALVEDAIESLAGMVVDSRVALEAGETSNAWVMADVDALNQVFGNLIENAMKYGGSGGRVHVGARLVEDAVEFYVQDFGPGIPSEHLHRIFERFYRVDKARSRESGGTGLGLAIVKHIILAHGGSIRAESELGSGSTFYFTLPVAAAPAGGSEIEAAAKLAGR